MRAFTTGCNVLTTVDHFMVTLPAFETLFQLTGKKKNDSNVSFDVFSMCLFMYMCACAHDLFLSPPPQPHMFHFTLTYREFIFGNGKGEGYLSSM